MHRNIHRGISRPASSSVNSGAGGGVAFLLDTFTGAAAAYSNKKLKSDWSGGFYTGITNATAWLDQSGNDRDLASPGSDESPAITAGGLSFDGANDAMFVQFTLNQPYTIFARFRLGVYDAGEVAGLNNIIDGYNVDTITFRRASSNLMEVYAGGFLTQNFPAEDEEEILVTLLMNGASSSIWKNSSLHATGNPGTNAPGGITLASWGITQRFADVEFESLVVYPSDKSSERTQIEAFL